MRGVFAVNHGPAAIGAVLSAMKRKRSPEVAGRPDIAFCSRSAEI